MPRPRRGTTNRQTRGREGAPHLQRQTTHKPVSTPTMIARERIQSQMSDLIVACEELFDEHGTECCCDGCALVSNFVGSLRLYRMLLEIT